MELIFTLIVSLIIGFMLLPIFMSTTEHENSDIKNNKLKKLENLINDIFKSDVTKERLKLELNNINNKIKLAKKYKLKKKKIKVLLKSKNKINKRLDKIIETVIEEYIYKDLSPIELAKFKDLMVNILKAK